MNYHVRVSASVWAGSPVTLAEIIEPRIDPPHDPATAELFDYVCKRALEIQKARELSLPVVILIEKQD